MMRGINTTVRRLRRKVFEEVAALGFKADADTLCDDMEAIPYALVNDETEQYRDSVYRARAVVREQVRLAMGLALRPEDKPVHLTAGVEASNISDKYYEPPLMQVIPSACMRCEATIWTTSAPIWTFSFPVPFSLSVIWGFGTAGRGFSAGI